MLKERKILIISILSVCLLIVSAVYCIAPLIGGHGFGRNTSTFVAIFTIQTIFFFIVAISFATLGVGYIKLPLTVENISAKKRSYGIWFLIIAGVVVAIETVIFMKVLPLL